MFSKYEVVEEIMYVYMYSHFRDNNVHSYNRKIFHVTQSYKTFIMCCSLHKNSEIIICQCHI